MIRHAALSLLLAGIVTVGAPPTASHAVVADNPQASFPSFDNTVHTLTRRGATIYVGGSFDRVTDSAGSYVRHGAAAVNVNTGRVLPWNPRVNGVVRDLVAAKEGVYLVGDFTRVKRQPRKNVARVALTSSAKLSKRFHPRPNRPVNTVALSKGRVMFGGNFTKVGRAERIRLAAVARKRPFKLTRWTPEARNGVVTDIVRKRSGVYVAGEFRSLNGSEAFERLALVTTKTGNTVRSFNPNTSNYVFDIAVAAGRVYAGIGGINGGAAVAYSRSDGSQLWQRRFDGDVQALARLRGELYVGGHFNAICDTGNQGTGGNCIDGQTSRRRGASLDASGGLTGWNPGLNSDLGITSFTAFGASERLVAGGDFTTANGGAIRVGRLAMFN